MRFTDVALILFCMMPCAGCNLFVALIFSSTVSKCGFHFQFLMIVGDTECEGDDSDNSAAATLVLMGQVMLQQNVLRAIVLDKGYNLRENGLSQCLQYNRFLHRGEYSQTKN